MLFERETVGAVLPSESPRKELSPRQEGNASVQLTFSLLVSGESLHYADLFLLFITPILHRSKYIK